MLTGMSKINLELSSRCDKSCSFCGHQRPEVNTKLKYGDMDIKLLERLSQEIPTGTVIAFHRDGEPLVYPNLGYALSLFRSYFITTITTNGKKLVEKHKEIIGNCDTLTVSAFRGDPDGPEQLSVLAEFIKLKGSAAPMVQVKWVGDGDASEYKALGVRIIRRLIWDPLGMNKYAHHPPTIPEVGICLDFLHHPSVDWEGNMFICNKMDPKNSGLLGNLHKNSLDDLWNGQKRMEWLAAHRIGRRDLASPLCKSCLYYGVPSER